MAVINMTPHAVTIGTQTFEPCGTVARVETPEVVLDKQVLDVPVVVTTTGSVSFGTVAQTVNDNDIIIVSSMVLDSLSSGHPLLGQVFAPDTGATAIRNEKGQIVAVTRLRGRKP